MNLLLDERLVPELLQDSFNADHLVELAAPLLDDPGARQAMLSGYKRLTETLGAPGVTDRAACAILDQLSPTPTAS